MKNSYFYGIVIMSISALLANGCTSSDQQILPTVSPNFNEVIFLSSQPCSAPCWQGLLIGESTESEVLGTISTINFIDQKAIRNIPQSVPDINTQNWVEGKNIVVTCINRREPCIRLTIARELLRDIVIKLDAGLTLEQVIIRLGNPDYVGSHPLGGDVIDCSVELMWSKKQLVVNSFYFSDQKEVSDNCYSVEISGNPSADLEIAEVRYLPLEDIEARIRQGRLVDFVGTN